VLACDPVMLCSTDDAQLFLRSHRLPRTEHQPLSTIIQSTQVVTVDCYLSVTHTVRTIQGRC